MIPRFLPALCFLFLGKGKANNMPKLTDLEITDKLNITTTTKVLDIGGSFNQHEIIKVDTLVDLIPPDKNPYWPSTLKAKKFVQLDITKEKLPFKDKEFDVCLCTHVLEDLYNPFLVIDEMSRVAKRGYIATPSRGVDMEFSHYNLTDWLTGARRQPGHSHHHWFFENKSDQLYVVPKIYPLLYTGEFQITNWTGEEESSLFWKDKINYEVLGSIDTHGIIKEYRKFMAANKGKYRRSPVLFYIDNPYYIVKELVKYLFHRGMGFVRKT